MIWQRNKNLLGLGREFIKKAIIPSQKYWLADILKGHVDPIKKKKGHVDRERWAVSNLMYEIFRDIDHGFV